MWLTILSDQRKIIGLVSLYQHQLPNLTRAHQRTMYILDQTSEDIRTRAISALFFGRFPSVTHPCATGEDLSSPVQLACVRHPASVPSEPGSNSFSLLIFQPPLLSPHLSIGKQSSPKLQNPRKTKRTSQSGNGHILQSLPLILVNKSY
jgi:hypothetical protein